MSDTTTENTDTIQRESSSDNYGSKITGFVTLIIISILVILLYFSSSGLILFVCKLAQSNILPTEAKCTPYTVNKPIIQPSPLQTNIFTTFTDPEMSMKLQIPYDINSGNKFIEILRNYKEKSSSHFLANYFISISEALLQFSYSGINTTMNLMNSTLPETAIIILGPVIAAFLYSIGILLNTIYFIGLWFFNMSWFFKTNKNDTGTGKPEWEDVTILTPVNWFIGLGLSILFTFFLIFGFPLVSIIPLILYHKSILSTLFYKGIMNGKQVNSFNIIKETLIHYKITIVTIISILVVLFSFLKLGALSGLFSIMTIALIYYGVISINIFQPIPEKNLTESVSYKQATKTCSSKIESKHKKWFFGLFGGQNGGNLTKELKKIGKMCK